MAETPKFTSKQGTPNFDHIISSNDFENIKFKGHKNKVRSKVFEHSKMGKNENSVQLS